MTQGRAALDPLQSVRLIGRFGVEQIVPVTWEDGRAWLDLDGRHFAGVWATICLIDKGSGDIGDILIDAIAAGPGGKVVHYLAQSAVSRSAFAWTGRFPDALLGLRLTPRPGKTGLTMAEVSVRAQSRLTLVGRGILRRPGLTAQAISWRMLGKRVRARHRLTEALTPPGRTSYDARVRDVDGVSEEDRTRLRAEIATFSDAPLISILMPVCNPDPTMLEEALRSVRSQIYRHWELCVVEASSDPAVPDLLARAAEEDPRIKLVGTTPNGNVVQATNLALDGATGAYVAFLNQEDVLAECALFEIAKAVRHDPALDLIYTDEDRIDARGRRHAPHFKSDWNTELLYTQDYIGHLTAMRTERVRDAGGLWPGLDGGEHHDLLLRFTDGLPPDRIRHLPQVLYHVRSGTAPRTTLDDVRSEHVRLQVLRRVIERCGWPHRADPGLFGFPRLVRALPDPAPRVSVVIPTRDRADLLEVALEGLLHGTDYPDLEVVILDNESSERETAALLARVATDPRVRVLPSPGAFNFSALSNQGGAAATGSILLFLNNDIEVTERGWLTEVVSIAAEPQVGAVGAKLSYPDGTLQHGGVVLLIDGVAGHSHLGVDAKDPGYFGRMAVAQEVSAVTGACLAIRADVFAEVGGFDAERLAVAFNDVDLCLRLRRAGYRIVWTPHAHLIHHESKSRGLDDTPEKRSRFEAESKVMRERWESQLRADPFYNPDISRISAGLGP